MSSTPAPWPPRRPGPEYRAWRKTQQAIKTLRHARDLAKAAGCRRTLTRIQLALSSAYGAERHAYGKYSRTFADSIIRTAPEARP